MKASDIQNLNREQLIALLENAKAGKMPVTTMWTVDTDGTVTRQRNGKRSTVTPETLVKQYNRDSDTLVCMQNAELPYLSNPGIMITDVDEETARELQKLFESPATKTINFYE